MIYELSRAVVKVLARVEYVSLYLNCTVILKVFLYILVCLLKQGRAINVFVNKYKMFKKYHNQKQQSRNDYNVHDFVN